MNALVTEIRKSLEVLTLGLIGELQMSDSMDNLLMRLKQLMDWQADLMLPKVAWLSGFFNPQSFLTAILQQQARKNEWPLDKVVVATEVTKKTPEEVDQGSKEGSYI